MAFTGTACGCDSVDEVEEDVVAVEEVVEDADEDADAGAAAGAAVRVGVGLGALFSGILSPAAGFTIRWKVADESSSSRTFENVAESSRTRPL
jgi:hypothetical protein